MDIISERWEQGDTETVGGIACHLHDVDVNGLPKTTTMMFEALRRRAGPYRPFGTTADLSPFWRDWLTRLETRVLEDTAFPANTAVPWRSRSGLALRTRGVHDDAGEWKEVDSQ